jgi:uncharacterized membrane protein
MSAQLKKYRLLTILLILVVTPIGFYTKFYAGPASSWVGNSFGGLVYEVFWCLVVAFLFPRVRPFKIASGVFLATAALEFLQLWHPGFLEFLRSAFIGRTILGSSFNWMDFPYYAAGSFMGWYLLKILYKTAAINPHTSGQP